MTTETQPKRVRILGILHTLYRNSIFLNESFFNLKEHKWLKENYMPTDNEILMVTNPKTGTTLTKAIMS